VTEDGFKSFLQAGVVLCLVMAVASTLLRWKRFGPSALALGGAFATFGLLLVGLKESWSQALIAVIGIVLVVLLAADMLLRTAREPKA